MWQASEGLIAILVIVFLWSMFSGRRKKPVARRKPRESEVIGATATIANNPSEIDVTVKIAASGNKETPFTSSLPIKSDSNAHLAAARGN
jgi:hypothetical protein